MIFDHLFDGFFVFGVIERVRCGLQEPADLFRLRKPLYPGPLIAGAQIVASERTSFKYAAQYLADQFPFFPGTVDAGEREDQHEGNDKSRYDRKSDIYL